MAYLVDTAEPVKQYLRAITWLSREGRLKLFTGYLEALRERGMNSARSRPPVIRETARSSLSATSFGTATGFTPARFVVDDSAAVYGVLRVVYADLLTR